MIDKRHAVEMHEGEGVLVKRLMPLPNFRNFDPFVLWDDFTINPGNGFPEHPHRGFEAITYLFSGSLRHEDNLGNASTVFAGGAQRFTAGRGIAHSEMPNDENPTRGIQLWINLPQRLKQMQPAYQQVDHEQFPVTEFNGGELKTIVGPKSPLQIQTRMHYLELRLHPQGQYALEVPTGLRGFIYVVEGEVELNGEHFEGADTAFFDQPGEPVTIKALHNSRLMICYGAPHGEPIIQYGPFVD